jgi:hypothetical protein
MKTRLHAVIKMKVREAYLVTETNGNDGAKTLAHDQ